MITSVAVQAYLTRIGNLLLGQGFKGIFHDPSISTAVLKNMRVVYDSEEAMIEEWLSDELASTKMKRKGATAKDDVRSGPFMALFWKRSSLEPIVRQRYRILDAQEESGVSGVYGKSTVSASFTIACVFVSNKAEAIEDLEEAFAAVFQNTYNMPLTLEYIYNAGEPEKKKTNFTYIQNMGESDLVNFKEGNLFAYSWSAKIFMNYVSEFAWSRVYPVEKVIIDLYDPKGVPLASLDAAGIAHTHDYTADTGEVVEDVPDEPLIAFTRAESHDYVPFAIVKAYALPYTEWNDFDSGNSEGEGHVKTAPNPDKPHPFIPPRDPDSANPPSLWNTWGRDDSMHALPDAYKILPEERVRIEGAIVGIGGEISLRGTDYMVVALMPLAANHSEGNDYDADVLATSAAISGAIKTATGDDYVVTPMPDGVGE